MANVNEKVGFIFKKQQRNRSFEESKRQSAQKMQLAFGGNVDTEKALGCAGVVYPIF